MSNQKNNALVSEDLKTDSIPDAPRERKVTDDQEIDASLLLPPKEEIINEERKTSSKSNNKSYLKLAKDLSFVTHKKSNPKSVPKSAKNKKEGKKSSHVRSGMNLTLCSRAACQH
jgi:hypothetical protein